MPLRDALASLTHGKQAKHLRDQLDGLLPERAGPTVAAVADDASARMRQWVDYAMLALELRQPIGELLGRVTGRQRRPEDVRAEQAAATERFSRKRWVARHPVFLAVGVIGLGIAAFELARFRRPLLQRANRFRQM